MFFVAIYFRTNKSIRNIFYTNYSSKKSQNILQNSNVAICFYFSELERQVNIQGVASKISEKKSIQYFNSRPLESKIAAIISNQSNVVPSRNYLEENFLEFFL